tara:strand:+ start:571 stop:759 length:189 start_codon:yes stop_codon:yes gene_type:complete
MKISDKLSKVDESFTVYMYDNGFMLDIQGRDKDDEWCGTKIMCTSIDEIAVLATEAAEMERS